MSSGSTTLLLRQKEEHLEDLNPLYGKMFVADIPELLNATFHYSKDGCLLLSRANDECCLFFLNPITNEKIDLPELDLRIYVISFSSPPTSPDCIVFAICTFNPPFWFLTWRPGDDAWTVHRTPPGNGLCFISAYTNPIFFDGAFHCLGYKGNLGIFDVINNSWKVLDRPRMLSKFRRQHCCLVESKGELLSVFMKLPSHKIRVFRFNRSEMLWTGLRSLGDEALFVNLKTSLSVTLCGGAENRVYFPSFLNHETPDLLSYSLETKSFNQVSYDCKRYSNCFWFDSKRFGTAVWI